MIDSLHVTLSIPIVFSNVNERLAVWSSFLWASGIVSCSTARAKYTSVHNPSRYNHWSAQGITGIWLEFIDTLDTVIIRIISGAYNSWREPSSIIVLPGD